jgi:two-component system chemotaxis response regulator CheY
MIAKRSDFCCRLYWEKIINWELIQQLSTSAMYGGIPVVVLSGLGEPETSAKCSEYNVLRYFLKPFNPIDLMQLIDQLVAGPQLKAI